jgi:uncharacterized membrane protein
VHFSPDSLVCGLGNCHTVQASDFATIGPVPIAILGLAMYTVVLACNVLIQRRPEAEFTALIVSFAVVLAGTMYAVYLTWVEIAVIGAICQWCVASALMTLGLAVTEGVALWHSFAEPTERQRETRSGRAAS